MEISFSRLNEHLCVTWTSQPCSWSSQGLEPASTVTSGSAEGTYWRPTVGQAGGRARSTRPAMATGVEEHFADAHGGETDDTGTGDEANNTIRDPPMEEEEAVLDLPGETGASDATGMTAATPAPARGTSHRGRGGTRGRGPSLLVGGHLSRSRSHLLTVGAKKAAKDPRAEAQKKDWEDEISRVDRLVAEGGQLLGRVTNISEVDGWIAMAQRAADELLKLPLNHLPIKMQDQAKNIRLTRTSALDTTIGFLLTKKKELLNQTLSPHSNSRSSMAEVDGTALTPPGRRAGRGLPGPGRYLGFGRTRGGSLLDLPASQDEPGNRLAGLRVDMRQPMAVSSAPAGGARGEPEPFAFMHRPPPGTAGGGEGLQMGVEAGRSLGRGVRIQDDLGSRLRALSVGEAARDGGYLTGGNLQGLGGGPPPPFSHRARGRRGHGEREEGEELELRAARGALLPSNPYALRRGELADDYYLSFPFPWNVAPEKGCELKPGDVLKVSPASIPKFGGYKQDYLPWRSAFLPMVHQAPIDFSLKLMLSRATLIPQTTRMKEMMNNYILTPTGYRSLIVLLEESYGGEDNLLVARQEAVLSLPELREGDFKNLEALYVRLSCFLDEWRKTEGNWGSETDSLAFFHILMNRVEGSYALKYMTWLRKDGKRKGLKSLRDWLNEELADLRAVETFARRRTTSWAPQREARGWERKAKEARRPPPPGYQDRNFPKESFFSTKAAEDWEDVEGTLGKEQDAEDNTLLGQEVERALPTQLRTRPPCSLCQEEHPLGRCQSFQGMNPQERRNYLVKQKRCFLCFQEGHNVNRCRHVFRCAECQGKHHTWVHGTQFIPATTPVTLNAEEELWDAEGAEDVLEDGLGFQVMD